MSRASGQVLVITAVLIPVVVLLGSVVWATLEYRADDAELGSIVRTAVLAGATSPDAASLAADAPILREDAVARARDALRAGLRTAYPDEKNARVDIDRAMAQVQTRIYNGSLVHPIRGPDGITLYHYPTLCLSDDISVGLLRYDGISFTHHYVGCAQLAL